MVIRARQGEFIFYSNFTSIYYLKLISLQCPLCHEVVINQDNKQTDTQNADNHPNEHQLEYNDLHNVSIN